jgi:putative MATE family efflux protein
MVSTVLGLLYPRQSLVIFQAADDVLDLGEVYLSTVASTFAAMAIMLVGTAALRGVGDTRTPMLIMAVVNVVNMVVAYVLIYGIGPFPALGVLGSALGAAIGRVVGFALVIGVLVRGHRGLRLRSRLLLPDATQFRRIIAIGAPAGAEMLVLRGGMMAFVATVASLGTSALAAHQIALTSESLSFMPGFGFSVAATTLVGQALGARRPRLAERSGWTACGMAALIMSAMGLLFFLFPEKFMAAFTDDPVVIALGSGPLRLVALVQPFLAASMVLSGALRGAGDTRWPLAITASGFWGVRLPLAFILAQTPLGLLGAWTGMAIDLALRGIATTLRFRCGGWTSIQV